MGRPARRSGARDKRPAAGCPRASRPRRVRHGFRSRRGDWPGAACGHRPRHRRPADRQRGRHDRRRAQRRDLQLPGAARGAASGAAMSCARRRHRGHRPPRRGPASRWSSPHGSTACSPSPCGTSARRRLVLGARPVRQEAAVLLARRPARSCSAARSRRVLAHPAVPARPRRRRDRCLPDVRLRPHPAHVLRRHPQRAARPRARRWRRLQPSTSSAYWEPPPLGVAAERARSQPRRQAGDRGARAAARRGRRAGSSPTCRSARSSAAASTRAPSSALMAEPTDEPVRHVHDRVRRRRGVRRAALRPAGRRAASAPTTPSSWSSPKAVDLVERLVWHHDQPFGDSSAIPTFLLAELTRST